METQQVMVKHIYLAPYLDDAILSCDDLIHRQRAAGETVVVLNLCVASPDHSWLWPFPQEYHAAGGICQTR